MMLPPVIAILSCSKEVAASLRLLNPATLSNRKRTVKRARGGSPLRRQRNLPKDQRSTG